ncbi:MAG: protein kinase [Vicinamibacterales bacterium]
MALTSGTRLGPYEISGVAGSGGMGDVYRAHDVRLNRDVAVKTLKGPFTERFEREAQAISALNHPNICTLYDVGQHDGSGYLVMEFIEGKPIAGPMPVEQAVAAGIQICEALHAAHKKGIVHRDLKPANIMVTKAGIKLLDFGLAKLASPASGVIPLSGVNVAAEQATLAALTGSHTVVGTPQYMAPEQIEAREVDARTDIFAFGCVLYELLTGQRPFEGQTSSSVMAAILATKPRPLEELLPLTPPALERIVSRCLAKDPEDRWQTARDVAAELQWVGQGGSKVGLPAMVSGRRRLRETAAWGAFAVAAIGAVGFAVAWVRRAPEPAALVRFPLVMPASTQNASPPVVSPDGRNIVFAAESEGKRMIWIRPLDALEARTLPGTEGAYRPFWAPDSRYVGFLAGTKLKKVDIAGGPPQTICDVPNEGDGTWNADGVIIFDGLETAAIRRVSAAGGLSQPVVFEDGKAEGKPGTGWPEFLPDGHHFLYVIVDPASPEMTVMVGDLDGKTSKTLFKTTTRVQYAAPGYLLFVRERTLVAQKFDAKSLTLQGEAVPIGEGLGSDDVGLASFSVSRNGVLVFRGGELSGTRIVSVDRNGKETPFLETAADYRDMSMSPDGKRFVYDLGDDAKRDLWIRDMVRGVSSRFTFDPAIEVNPKWSPDGGRIAYTSKAKGLGDLYVKDASGTRDAEPLVVDKAEKYVTDFSSDGNYVLFTSREAGATWDLWAMRLSGDRKPFPLAKTTFGERWATISPNGKYIAYQSDESGQQEVYVQEFPEARTKSQVSTGGGVEAYWSGDGRELFYRSGSSVMAVSVESGAAFSAGAPKSLFQTRFATISSRGRYRPTPDGQHFFIVTPPARETEQPASVLLNWTAALK